jgi:hypothetical protein
MKLAEALVLRADRQKRIEQLRERLKISALIQEGDEPPENPQRLQEELERLFGQLETLISAINRTNIQVVLPNGKTVTEALAQRDILRLCGSVLHGVAEIASRRTSQ